MDKMVLVLFLTFLRIGALSIGGGYAIIPLIQEQVVNVQGWLTLQEYIDIIAISQMTPGPLVVNTASFVGIRIAGIMGAVAATVGSILTGFVVSILLYNFFKRYKHIGSVANVLKGLRASSVGLIASAAATIILLAFFGEKINANAINYAAVAVFALSLVLLRKYKLSPMLTIALTGVVGLFLYI